MLVAYGRHDLCAREPSLLISSVNRIMSWESGGDLVCRSLNSRTRGSGRLAENCDRACASRISGFNLAAWLSAFDMLNVAECQKARN